jgi:hypothetical protein
MLFDARDATMICVACVPRRTFQTLLSPKVTILTPHTCQFQPPLSSSTHTSAPTCLQSCGSVLTSAITSPSPSQSGKCIGPPLSSIYLFSERQRCAVPCHGTRKSTKPSASMRSYTHMPYVRAGRHGGVTLLAFLSGGT